MKQTRSNLNKRSVQTLLLDYLVNERSEETFTFEFVDEDCASKDGIEPSRTKVLRANMPGKDRDRDAITSNDRDLRREGNGEQDEFRAGEGKCR